MRLANAISALAIAVPTFGRAFFPVDYFPEAHSSDAVSVSNDAEFKETVVSTFPKRDPGDKLLADAMTRGLFLTDACYNSDPVAAELYEDSSRKRRKVPTSAQSEFNTFPDGLINWGYSIYESGFPYLLDDDMWGIDEALSELGISHEAKANGGNFAFTKTRHVDEDKEHDGIPVTRQTYTINGVIRRKTNAKYHLATNVADGIILAQNRESPASAGKELSPPVPEHELPVLKRSSDIMFGQWAIEAQATKKDIKGIKYFMALSIINEDTNRIIKAALKIDDIDDVRHWPGHDFFPRDDGYPSDFEALLGSPNANGFGYFLAEHKRQLGNMWVTHIRVFREKDVDDGPNMLLYVESVPENSDHPRDPKRHCRGVGVESTVATQAEMHDEGNNITRVHRIRAKL